MLSCDGSRSSLVPMLLQAALATADAKLWSKADTRFEDVADALFEVHNEFTFLQVGAYTGTLPVCWLSLFRTWPRATYHVVTGCTMFHATRATVHTNRRR